MENFGIARPCSENWNNMKKNATGAFCQSCKKNVIDFTSMNNSQIRKTLFDSLGQETCGKILPQQVSSLNNEFERWKVQDKRSLQKAFVFTLIVVFGFSLFSCSDEKQREEIQQIRQKVTAIVNEPQQTDSIIETKTPEVELPPEFVGVMSYPEIFTVVERPEVVEPASEYYIERSYQGGLGYSSYFTDYLEETVVEVADEYDENGLLIPKEFSALAYPNPTRDFTTLEIKLPTADDFTVLLMDMNGNTLSVIHSGEISRGTFSAGTDLSEYPPGTYFIAISSASFKNVVKIIKI